MTTLSSQKSPERRRAVITSDMHSAVVSHRAKVGGRKSVIKMAAANKMYD